MRPSLILLVLYVGAVVVATAYLFKRPDAPEVTLEAARLLPEGHLVEDRDLFLHPDGRQYLPRALGKGKSIDAGELLTDPVAAVTQGTVPLAVTVERALTGADLIDAGSKVSVCPGGLAARVRALFCAPGAETCLSVVEMAAGDAEGLKDTATLSLRGTCG